MTRVRTCLLRCNFYFELFSLVKQFYFKQFSLAQAHSLVLFDPQIEPYQVLPLRAKVNQGAIAMKGYSVFSKAPWNLTIRLFSVIFKTLVRRSYPSAQKRSVYSTAPANWARHFTVIERFIFPGATNNLFKFQTTNYMFFSSK